MQTNTRPTRSLLALALVAAAGCASPLVSRRAQTLEPGEIELSLVPYAEGTMAATKDTATTPFVYPFAEATARFGVVERVDIQLKVDPTIIPEVNLAYQLVGDPTKNDFAVTVSGGIKPTVFAVPGAFAGLVATPVSLIVDVPVGDNTFIGGVRTIPAMMFAGGAGGGGSIFTVAPGGFAAFQIPLGPSFFVRPELAMNGVLPLAVGAGSSGVTSAAGIGTVNLVASIGLGGTIDFNKAKDDDKATRESDAPPPALGDPAE